MNIAIIQYNSGNTQSVAFALERIGATPLLTGNAADIAAADKVIFPGVGAAGQAMSYLRQRGLDQVIRDLKQPVLGICLGMQLMCRHSEEDDTDGLAIFDENVVRFPLDKKVPHMGWNQLKRPSGKLFTGIEDGSYVYFVHSYYAPVGQATVCETGYSGSFSAALNKDNFYAVQFHPEKSGAMGERILQNFLAL